MNTTNTERKMTIQTLPAETLSDIFILYRNGFPPPSLGWIIITHVCQVWRAVGLGHAALWDTVNIRSPAAASEVLARARYTPPLYVHLPAPLPSEGDWIRSDPIILLSPSERALIARLADTRWRICDVYVVGKRDEVLATLNAVAHSSVHVRTLCIANYGMPALPILDDTLCESAFPQLHTLVQCGYCLDLTSQAYGHSLRSLTIDLRDPEVGSQCDFEFYEILDLLKRLACLERLALCFCSSEELPDEDDDNEAISLDRLQHLKLVDTVEYCVALLELLCIPTDCEIDVEIGSHSEVDLDTALSAVHLVFDADTRQSMSLLTVSINTLDGGYVSVISEGLTTRRVSIPVEDDDTARTYFCPLCIHLFSSPTNLISFSLELGEYNEIDMSEELAPTISAKNVRVAMDPWGDIESALFPLLCTMNSCPDMCTLTVEGLDFNPLEYITAVRPDMAYQSKHQEAVLRVVEQRGMPRSAVLMKNCYHVDEETRKRWEGCIWDNASAHGYARLD